MTSATLSSGDLALIHDLIDVGRDMVQRGLVLASGGNLSVRLESGLIAVTGAGTWLDRLTVEDFALLQRDGTHRGGAERASSEWRLHTRSYAARPDISVVLHAHPQHAVLLATLGKDIRLLTLDHAFYVRSIGVTEFFPNGSEELATTAAEALHAHDCVIMKHHGCSVVADSVSMAYRRLLNLEDAAKASLIALQLGDTSTVFPESADGAHHA